MCGADIASAGLFEDGAHAHKQGDYATALRVFLPLSVTNHQGRTRFATSTCLISPLLLSRTLRMRYGFERLFLLFDWHRFKDSVQFSGYPTATDERTDQQKTRDCRAARASSSSRSIKVLTFILQKSKLS